VRECRWRRRRRRGRELSALGGGEPSCCCCCRLMPLRPAGEEEEEEEEGGSAGGGAVAMTPVRALAAALGLGVTIHGLLTAWASASRCCSAWRLLVITPELSSARC
jgi:hypothetical protein